MDEVLPRPPGARPWFLWLTDRSPGSPIWVGVALSALLFVLFLALRAAGLVRPPVELVFSPEVGERILLSFIAVAGVGIATMPWMERAALRDLEGLRPRLRVSARELAAVERSLTHFSSRGMGLALFVGFGVHLVASSAATGFSSPPHLGPQAIFALVAWTVLATTSYVLFSQALRFRRLASDLSSIPLFDLRPLTPFARVGLRTALFYAGFFAITLVAHRDWSAGGLGLPDYVVAASIVWVPACVALATLPVWGAHQRIRAEKHAELDRVGEAIRGAPDALAASPMAAHAAELRGVALLEYREKVEAVREWPFDAAGLRRLALYTFIPPLGWLGGALMERALDALLG